MFFRLYIPKVVGAAAMMIAGGVLAAAPVELVPEDFHGAQQPQVTVDESGNVWVAFGRGDEIQVVASRDGGRSFELPVKVGALAGLELGGRRGPRVAASGASVTVTAVAQDVFAFHSTDGGRTWSAPVRINSVPRSAREGLHNLAGGRDGRFYVTWLDLRSGEMEVYGALSRDAGKTWGENELVYRSPDGHVCECCHPSAAFNADGDLVVMWRNWLNGSRDLWTTVRRAGKDKFEPAAKQGEGTWKLPGCPMDGGAVFALGDGSFASTWRRDKEVFLSLQPGSERRLGEGVHPVAIAANGTVQAWWQRGADLVHASAEESKAPVVSVFATNARFANAAVSPKDGAVVVVFERTVGARETIFADVIR